MRQRHYFRIPAALRDSANQFASQIGIDPGGKLDSFTCGLVPKDGPGDAAPTWYLADGQMTEAIRLTLEASQDLFPGAMWWRVMDGGASRGELVATNTSGVIGSLFDIEADLDGAGLKRRDP